MRVNISPELRYPGDLRLEVVERKGLGHPDTLADGVAERISVDYSKYTLDKFGVIPRHNVDKVNVLGGFMRCNWGEGEMLAPVRVIVNGRMSQSFGGEPIPTEQIQEEAARSHLGKILPNLDVNRWVDVHHYTTARSRNPIWFNPNSKDDLPEYSRPFANDTSVSVGYWPLTPAENLAIGMEGFFYDKDQKAKFADVGQDIKVMVVRRNKDFDVTMCVPFIAPRVESYAAYRERVSELHEGLSELATQHISEKDKLNLNINTQDQMVRDTSTVAGVYMLVGGSALDYGEEGLVGRGNNRRGIIPSFRTHSMEAAWGKNPVYHVGKVMGLVADTSARRIAEELDCRAEVLIATRFGDPLYEPDNILIKTGGRKVSKFDVTDIMTDQLSKRDWTQRIVTDEVFIPKANYSY